jgi:DNA polymerase-3 subunit delta'
MAADSQITRLREKKQVDIPVDLLREHIIGGTVKQESRVFTPAVYLSPNRSPRRIFIIDEAELLNVTGQNALLKTLEEPPPTSVLILLTTNPARLLPTIRSRCQALGFKRLEDDAMSAWLAREAPEADSSELAWARSFADGSPGRFLFALKHELGAWYEQIQPGLEMLAEGRFPPNLWQEFSTLIDEFAKECEKSNRRTSLEAAKREGLDVVLAIIATDLRNRMHAAADLGEHSIAEACARAIDHLVEAERRVSRSLNLKLVLADMTAALSESLRVPSRAS